VTAGAALTGRDADGRLPGVLGVSREVAESRAVILMPSPVEELGNALDVLLRES